MQPIAIWKGILIYAGQDGFLYGQKDGKPVEIPQDVLKKKECMPWK